MTEQELEVQVESEANQYIPFSLDEVSLDFALLGLSKTLVTLICFIAASRREKVQDRQGFWRRRPASCLSLLTSSPMHPALSLTAHRSLAWETNAMVTLFEVGA